MQQKKPIILALVHYYLPGFKSGGPVRSIANLVDQLSDVFDFRIITLDRDKFDKNSYPNVTINSWNSIGKAQVYYISENKIISHNYVKLFSEIPYDVLYINSFFDPLFAQWPLLLRRLGKLPNKPIVIAPRGEFSSGALFIKYWKKIPYLWLSSILGTYRSLIWAATSNYEAEDIRKAVGLTTAQRIIVTPNLIAQYSDNAVRVQTARNDETPLRIVFISRVSPKKNLDFALRVLARLKCPVHFDIYGPIDSVVYWKQCQALMANLPINVYARYHGPAEYKQVSGILAEHDLFFFPTRGENFGHVIIESIMAGTPVLIADTTPWRHLEMSGVGWELPLADEQQFANKINYVAQISGKEYVLLRERVLAYAKTYHSKHEAIASTRSMFFDALS